ncbi:hypothetical protein K3G63_20970 [Hymenobacter sp. HSC-4F20]|uniref:hypothetical protein n=1 Tax=Hymenobacter sp. HSC-4F20 TaxID=2864135 RepID=UPI001C72C4D8|nr:hypothetical protein [Hymenobacter sp. HSC-4F20]MBX0292928.1 hypothetical protein [Hymenobacter sp. HSC-4F20]
MSARMGLNDDQHDYDFAGLPFRWRLGAGILRGGSELLGSALLGGWYCGVKQR